MTSNNIQPNIFKCRIIRFLIYQDEFRRGYILSDVPLYHIVRLAMKKTAIS